MTVFNNLPGILLRYRLWVGLLAILICAATWTVDLLDLVYNCPYCRAQRTVIGLLGLLLLMPNLRFWLVRYLSAVFAVFGLGVATTQHFGGYARMNKGEFEWGEMWFINPWLLSGAAIFIITGLVLLIWTDRTGD
ncbi:hypothetical protein MWU38_01045 [Qipengyuania sp. S6317L1]|uniref:hypothetical protein n=1 Tax=Qipengyuania sp. S6317L1 TaxID=2926410 RepID=UPI001FF3BD7B|nr:hypothetical protein [Qipengyuania sp. S6317L1]MCK0097955.1 hypothetical protein [Qipengyuania sp. S6317L1]